MFRSSEEPSLAPGASESSADDPTLWRAELSRVRDAAASLTVGRFTLAGEPLYLNRGMTAVLGGAEPDRPRSSYLVNPTFAQLLAAPGTGRVFRGCLTVGDGYRMSRTLHAEVYRKGGELLICGEYDVEELARLESELSRTNQEINNLQRDLLQKNARLAHTLAEAEQQLKTLRDSEQRFRRIVEHIADPVMVTDLDAHIRAVNPAFSRVTGYASEEVLGRTPKVLASGHHSPAVYDEMRQVLGTQGRWQGNIWNRRKNGEVYVQRLSISSLRDSADAGLYVAVYSDIADAIEALERAQFQAEHDALTGLPNRLLLMDRLTEALHGARRRADLVAVLFIDLDRFKPINDTHGHAVGDAVLQTVARRLRESVRQIDSVARLGGDEFVVILRDLKSRAYADRLAAKVLDLISQPIVINGLQLSVGASIGVGTGPEPGDTAADLLHRADLAMYAVKHTHHARAPRTEPARPMTSGTSIERAN